MSAPRHQIQHHLLRIARRERTLLTLESLSVFIGVMSAGMLVAVLALNLGYRAPVGGLMALALSAVAIGGWRFRDFRRAGEVRRQALRVEAALPLLAGELLTVLDRSARPLGSEVLVERMARRVLAPVQTLPLRAVHPARPAVLALVLAACLGLLFSLTALLPIGPGSLLAAYQQPAQSPPPLAPVVGPRAVVGDITLRYLYPVYTGLAPMEVPNSNGDVHAPPGTTVEVRARSQVAWTSAVLELEGGPEGEPGAVELGPDRSIRSSLTVPVAAAGDVVWRFRFQGGGGSMLSPDYRVILDADLAPQVAVDARQNRASMAVNEPLGVPWRVHDDYGIRKVVIEVRRRDKTWEVEVRAPINVITDLDGRLLLTPEELNLQPGDSARLRVKAWDNDDVSGSKPGWSGVIEVTVSGAGGDHSRLLPARKELRDALVLVLADFLLDPEPALDVPLDGAAWSKRALGRYDDYDSIVGRSWAAGQGMQADRTALQEVEDRRRTLFALVRAAPAAGLLAGLERDALVAAQRAHVVAVEGAVLLFDQMVQTAALKRVSELAQQMADEAAEMNADFPVITEENAAAALARLDQLERVLRELSAAAAQLGQSSLGEFTNQAADRMKDMLAEARKAMQEGRFDDAKTQMDRIAEEMRQFADGLADQQKRGEESSQALGNEMKELDQKLEALQADQAALRDRTEQAREKHGPGMDEAVAIWKEIEGHAQSAVAASAVVTAGAGPIGGAIFRGANDLKSEAEGLLDAARARNAELARSRAETTAQEARGYSRMLGWAAQDGQRSGLPEVSRTVPAIQAHAEKIQTLLERLARAQAPPELQQALQKLSAEQQKISERAQELSKQAEGVAQQLPMKAPGLQKGAEQASAETARAADAMRRGDPMSAAGGQQAAEDGIQEARDALQQAAETLQSMGEGEGAGKAGEEPSEGGQHSGDQNLGMMAIPAPEEFETDRAYREALMEGMQGEVPEQYRSTNLRYYEELVRQ